MNSMAAYYTYWVSGKDELLGEIVSWAEKKMGVCYMIVTKLQLCRIVPKVLTALDTLQAHRQTGGDGYV